MLDNVRVMKDTEFTSGLNRQNQTSIQLIWIDYLGLDLIIIFSIIIVAWHT